MRPAGGATRRLAALGGALVLASTVVTAACTPEMPPPPPEATLEALFRPAVPIAPTPTPTPPPALGGAEVGNVLEALVCWYEDPALAAECLPPGEETLDALQRVARSGDRQFIAPLVDMLWLDVGWERWVRETLEVVSGERFATPAEWYAWMTAERPPLPDGYTAWKGRLLSIVDPGFATLVQEGPGVRPEQLVWSLLRVNALPALRQPATLEAGEQGYLGGGDTVFGVVVEGEARAYPERIIGWHGVVEDTVNGRDIVVVHCAPCGGATVFGATASDGERYTLGVSGLVAESRNLLVDEETSSLWDAVTGVAVAGPAASARLPLLHSVRTTWSTWLGRHPDTRVLGGDTGEVRDYSEGAAIEAAEGTLFPVSNLDPRLDAKTRVVGVHHEGAYRAYPLEEVERAGVVHDSLGEQPIVLLSSGPGTGVTVYEADELTVDRVEGTPVDRDVVDSTGQRWFVNDERLLNARNSRERAALPSQVGYWSAWAGAHPETGVWTP
ncbi:MAG: DUF3179 domain-containing (seleno)protein [Dehalococcoidia bacterium]